MSRPLLPSDLRQGVYFRGLKDNNMILHRFLYEMKK